MVLSLKILKKNSCFVIIITNCCGRVLFAVLLHNVSKTSFVVLMLLDLAADYVCSSCGSLEQHRFPLILLVPSPPISSANMMEQNDCTVITY